MENDTKSKYSAQTRKLNKGYYRMHFKGLIALLATMVLSSCNVDKQTRVDQSVITFKTDYASNLYFKNVRQFYYEFEEMEAAKLNIFRLKKRETASDFPVINLAIVNNWRYDQAYLLLEPNAFIEDGDRIKVKWVGEGGQQGEVHYEKGNNTKQVAFADSIYEQIQKGSTFSVEIKGFWEPWLNTQRTLDAFRITVFDYYKLVKRI